MASKGSERPGHKYLTREWKNGKWVYYYQNSRDAKYDEKGYRIRMSGNSPSSGNTNTHYVSQVMRGSGQTPSNKKRKIGVSQLTK